ncbi:MAG: GTPase [Candidatus Woesearchaeota archaeon]
MPNFWNVVNKVIGEADVLLLVLDARMPELTRNREIESKIRRLGKKMIYVINKCDLVGREELEAMHKKYVPSVFVSGRDKLGGTLLFKQIMEASKGERCTVGVLGYPNTGKSSIINLLKGSKSARVSSFAGYTRGVQFFSAKNLKLIDTPGVLSFQEKDVEKKVLIGAVNPEDIDDPDVYAAKLIEMNPGLFEEYFAEKIEGNPAGFLERVALKKNIIMKGNKPDIIRLARTILKNWQTGKMHNGKTYKRSRRPS